MRPGTRDGSPEEKARLDRAFPRKRVSAGALLRGPDDTLLIVQPRYREHWLMPGGICEENESPHQALLREVKEELDLDVIIERVACVDYLAATDGFSEAIHFLFECRPLTPREVDAIRPDPEEILAWEFATPDKLRTRLVPAIVRRLDALRPTGAVYCENGTPIAMFEATGWLRSASEQGNSG